MCPHPPLLPPFFNKHVVIYGCSSSTDGWPNWTQAAASPTCLKKRSQRGASVEVSSAGPVYQLATLYLFAIFHAVGRSCCAIIRCKSGEQNQEKPFLKLWNWKEKALRAFHRPNKISLSQNSKRTEFPKRLLKQWQTDLKRWLII